MSTEYPTLPRRLLEAAERYASPRAQLYKQGGQWLTISSAEMLRRIAGLSGQLAKLGIAQGDRIALFAPNCPEWHVADFAVLGLGAVVVPIYFRESAERMAYILAHSEAKAIFVAGEEQLRRWSEIAPAVRTVQKAIYAGAAAGRTARTSADGGGAGRGGSGGPPAYEGITAGAGAGGNQSHSPSRVALC